MQFSARFVLIVLLFMIFQGYIQPVNAQRCMTDERMEPVYAQNPEMLKEFDEKASLIRKAKTSNLRAEVVTIPVHFIIVHSPGEEVGTGDNLSMDHILSQLQVMNEDFRRLNSDAVNTPAVFAAADSEVEFCLATIDPMGNSTDGVTRYPTNQNFDPNEFSIKQETNWPRDTYLNIWVAPNIGALGYAYVPSTGFLPNAVLDGVVCRTSAFGDIGFATHPVYNLGRTVTHEIGHYLGLGHIWRNDGCGADDGFDDTPKQDDENFGCRNHPSPSCNNGGDMFMNYMDYVDDDCMNAFTVDQNTYMHLILNGPRSSLLTASDVVCSLGPSALLATIEIEHVECNGDQTGAATITATGGIPGYQYSLDNITFSADNIFSDLPAGDYIAYVEDSEGTIFQVEFSISEPDPVEIFVEDSVSPSCFDGSDGVIAFSATGGTEPYLNITINGTQVIPLEPYDQLPSGFYTIEVEDANGCISMTEIELVNPEELVLEVVDLQGIGCAGELGIITAGSFGGTGEISFSLDGTQFTDFNVFEDLSMGLYTLFGEDEFGCTAELDFTIDEYIPINVEFEEINHVLCAGDGDGSIVIVAEGGNSPFTYILNETEMSIDGSFQNLEAGAYDIVVSDQNGCTEEVFAEITEPQPLTISIQEVRPASCSGSEDGTIIVSSSGGNGIIEYSIDAITFSSDPFFDQLESNIYQVTVMDENGCTTSVEVEIGESPPIQLDVVNIGNITCFGAADGSVELGATGGAGDYSYSLDGTFFDINPSFQSLTAGTYDGYVRDANGCIQTVEILMTEPAVLEIKDENILQVKCNGESSGAILFEVTGGTGLIDVSLNGKDFQQGNLIDFDGLEAGTYLAEIKDDNNCTLSATYIITEPSTIVVNLIDISSDNGSGSGLVTIQLTGGNPPYVTNGTTIDQNEPYKLENLEAGDYEVIFTDANGCQLTVPVVIPLNTGIDNTRKNEFLLFPNPNNGEFFMRMDDQKMNSFEILSTTGKTMFKSAVHQDQQELHIQLFDIPSGVYVIRVKLMNDRVSYQKMIIQRKQ